MRVLISLLIALAALTAAPAYAKPREHRLSAAEIRDLARQEMLWCDGYEAKTDDCNAVTLLRLGDDDRIVETTALLISERPRLQVVFGDTDEIKGDAICSVMNAAEMPMAFTLENRAVPAPLAAQLRAQIGESFADLDGKTVCQSFYQGEDKTRLREQVTVDGKRRRDLESDYVLRPGEEGFALRAQIGADDETTDQKSL